MKIEIFVQARMQSTRLPGKVLMPILQKPMLYRVMERLSSVTKADGCVVLTTDQTADQKIVEFCDQEQFEYFRGSEEDVLARYYMAAEKRNVDHIVRITSDCPVIEPHLIDQFLEEYFKSKVDLVCNVVRRTFPRGLDIEIFSKKALETAYREAQEQSEREHVTLFFYRHPERFQIKNMTQHEDRSSYRWTVDTIEDLQLIRLFYDHLYALNPNFDQEEILRLLTLHPEWNLINAEIKQKSV